VREQKVRRCLLLVDVHQLFLADLEGIGRATAIAVTTRDGQRVPEEGDAGFGFLSQVIDACPGHDHLRLKRHLPGMFVADVVEEAPNVCCAARLASNRRRGINQGVVGQCAQEANRVEQVRLASSIGAGDAREGSEPHVHLDEVLEAVDLEPCEHGATPSSPSLCSP